MEIEPKNKVFKITGWRDGWQALEENTIDGKTFEQWIVFHNTLARSPLPWSFTAEIITDSMRVPINDEVLNYPLSPPKRDRVANVSGRPQEGAEGQ